MDDKKTEEEVRIDATVVVPCLNLVTFAYLEEEDEITDD
jgi:hypothetical protein